MDLALTDDQQLFHETVHKFLQQECPIATVRAWTERPEGFDPAWWRQAAELGFTSFLVSEADGGGSISGDGLLDLAIVAEEMGRVVAPGPLVSTNVVAGAVSSDGSDEQRSRLLPGVLAGETPPAWGGPGGGVAMTRDGDTFVLRGVQAPVESPVPSSELLIGASGPTGLTQFLVPLGAPGVTVTPLETIDLARRFASVRFDDVRLDAATVLGAVGGGAASVARQARIALVLQCAESVGALDHVFTSTVEYLGDRYSFGRSLASYQALKHRLADMKLWLENAHAVTTLAVGAVQDGADDSDELVHAAAAYVGTIGTELVHQAVQLHGGIGVTWEHELHVYLRRVTLNRNLLGTPAHHLERLAEISLDRLESP